MGGIVLLLLLLCASATSDVSHIVERSREPFISGDSLKAFDILQEAALANRHSAEIAIARFSLELLDQQELSAAYDATTWLNAHFRTPNPLSMFAIGQSMLSLNKNTVLALEFLFVAAEAEDHAEAVILSPGRPIAMAFEQHWARFRHRIEFSSQAALQSYHDAISSEQSLVGIHRQVPLLHGMIANAFAASNTSAAKLILQRAFLHVMDRSVFGKLCLFMSRIEDSLGRYAQALNEAEAGRDALDRNSIIGAAEHVTSLIHLNQTSAAQQTFQHAFAPHSVNLNTIFPQRLKLSCNVADASAAELSRRLHSLQNPGVCSRTRALVLHLGGAYDHGVGSALHLIHNALSAALRSNRTLVMAEQDQWLLVDPTACPIGSWACYWEPISKCRETKLGVAARSIQEMKSDQDLMSNVRVLQARLCAFGSSDCTQCLMYVPEEFSGKGLLWFRAQLAAFMWRPNRVVLDHIQHMRVTLDLSDSYLAVHLRRSDKIREIPLLPLNAYETALKPVRSSLRTNELFVATDSDLVIPTLQQWHDSDLFEVHVLQQPRSGHAWWRAHVSGAVNATTETLNTLADVQLMVQSKAFVGALSSNLARLVYELMLGRRECAWVTSVDVCWTP